MKSKSITLGVFLSVLLVVVTAGLYWMAHTLREGIENYQLSTFTIRKIQQLESQWSIETARVRSDPLADFDALITFIPRIERLKENLAEAMLSIPDLPEKLVNHMNAYLSAVDAKEERIERFKTGYAILRNSVRYLPLAATNVMQQVQDRGGEPAFIRNISGVTDEINMYLATPAPPEKERLMRVLEELGTGIIARYPDLTNTIANFVAHGQVLLDKQAPTEETFQEATSTRITDLGENLINGLEAERSKKETQATYYERGILAAGGALWLVWLAIALQMPKNATQPEEPVAQGEIPVTAPTESADSSPAPAQEDAGQGASPASDNTLRSRGATVASAPDADLEKLTAALTKAEERGETGTATQATSQRVGLEVVAEQLTTVAERINSSMDILSAMNAARAERHHDQATPQADTQAGDTNERDEDAAVAADEARTAAAVVSSIRGQTNGIVELAGRLPSFSQQQADGSAPIDLNTAIDEAVDNTQAETRALVVKEFHPIPEVLAVATEVDLILTNVIENSLWGIQERGRKTGVIRIETQQEDREVSVTITDNGVGITPEHRRKVFNPFYTSRDDALGMGLAAAQYLVQKYNGTISLNSLPGQGTMVRIVLPTAYNG